MKLLKLSLLVFLTAGAHAQTVEQVASEVDQVEVDLVTVNSKADQAKGKADANSTKVVGVESRVTQLEGNTASINTQVGDAEARIATLELADPANQTQVDSLALTVNDVVTAVAQVDQTLLAVSQDMALQTDLANTNAALAASEAQRAVLEARVLELETAPPPQSNSKKYVVRDANGKKVDEWTERNLVGIGAMPLASGLELKCLVDKEKVTFVPKKPIEGFVYENHDCSSQVNKVFVIVTDDRRPGYQYQPSPVTFDNEVEGELIEGALYVPNWQNGFYVSGGQPLHRRVPSAQGDGSYSCHEVMWDGGNLAFLRLEANLPTFTPPFSMTEE